MSRPTVVVLDDYQRVAHTFGGWERLEGRAEVRFESEHARGEDLLELIGGNEIIVAMRERSAFDAATLAALPNLKLLVTTGMGNAAIDLAAAAALGITVCGTASLGPPTAELTWALLLALTRKLGDEERALREGTWQTTVGGDLAGRTLGIIGLGRLGEQIARVANAFGMRVLAWSENLTDGRALEVGATRAASLEAMLRDADFVTVHTRLSPRTRGLIGSAQLAMMKPGALLINTSRGPIVDVDALVAALAAGTIGGAALDVFDVERPVAADSRLRTAPNLILTPHIGYVTAASYDTFFTGVVEDIEAWLDGAPIRLLT